MAITISSKQSSYRKGTTIMFVYQITGTTAELAEFKKNQGDYYREDESTKVPLFFSANRPGSIGDELHWNKKKSQYQLHADLEAQIATLQTATTNALGKIEAIQQFTGMSKAQMQERLLASFAS